MRARRVFLTSRDASQVQRLAEKIVERMSEVIDPLTMSGPDDWIRRFGGVAEGNLYRLATSYWVDPDSDASPGDIAPLATST